MFDRFIEILVTVTCFGGLLFCVGFLFIVLPIVWYSDMHSPTFELRKDSWGCTASHSEVSSVKSMHHEYVVCDQWTRGA